MKTEKDLEELQQRFMQCQQQCQSLQEELSELNKNELEMV